MNRHATAMLLGAVLGMATGHDPSNPSPSRHDREPRKPFSSSGKQAQERRTRQIKARTLRTNGEHHEDA